MNNAKNDVVPADVREWQGCVQLPGGFGGCLRC